MREHKYRAWNKKYKRMEDCESWDSTFVDKGLNEILRDKYYIYLQYTGLKDKSGKEIYEGDIVRNPHGDLAEIRWHKMGFTTYSITKLFRVPFLKDVEYEVMGNIYER
jgi:uncharacterized phage protein (TIGR01671 family)